MDAIFLLLIFRCFFLFIQQQIIVFCLLVFCVSFTILMKKALRLRRVQAKERETIFQLTHVEKKDIGFIVVFVFSACLVVFKTICGVYFWVNICYECLGKSVGFGCFLFLLLLLLSVVRLYVCCGSFVCNALTIAAEVNRWQNVGFV